MKQFKRLALTTAALGLAACGTSDSENYDLDEICIDAKVRVESHQVADVEVNLREDDLFGDSLQLTADDEMQLTFNNRAIRLRQDVDIMEVDYEGKLDTQGDTGWFSFAFYREGSRAIYREVELPKAFAVTAPFNGQVLQADDAITMLWSNGPEGPRLKVSAQLTCHTYDQDTNQTGQTTSYHTWSVHDDGSAPLELTQTLSSMAQDVLALGHTLDTTRACEMELHFVRENSSSLASVFAYGSELRVQQYREVKGLEVWLNN